MALAGDRVRLRALEPADYPILRRIELSSYLAQRWRHHGMHEPPESFGASLWGAALVHFIAEDARTGAAFGLLSAYNPDLANGTAYVAAAQFAPASGLAPRMVGAFALMVDYVFDCWPMRKLYLEVAAYNLVQFSSGLSWLFDEEANLRDHVFLEGRYWNLYILSLWRDRWASERGRLVRFA